MAPTAQFSLRGFKVAGTPFMTACSVSGPLLAHGRSQFSLIRSRCADRRSSTPGSLPRLRMMFGHQLAKARRARNSFQARMLRLIGLLII